VPLIDYDPRLGALWSYVPVVHVRDWSRVTPKALHHLWRQIQRARASFRLEKAYWSFWLSVLREPRAEEDTRPDPCTNSSLCVLRNGVHIAES
jgi:hypothetical protein